MSFPESVTAAEPDFVNPTPPARFAETLPDWTRYGAPAVSVMPVTLPETSVSWWIASLLATLRMPPDTETSDFAVGTAAECTQVHPHRNRSALSFVKEQAA